MHCQLTDERVSVADGKLLYLKRMGGHQIMLQCVHS